MISMMEDFIGAYGNRLIVAVVGVGVALLVLAIALWLLRRRSGSAPFIRGGRNRQPRLQVLDATAVDARRRLVLVRRDDTEHLLLLGSHGDLVIESNIPVPEGSQQTARAWSKLRAEEPPARPDLRQAELQLAAADLDVSVARARYYPSLSIEAGAGVEAFELSRLTTWPESIFYGVFAGIGAPLFNRAVTLRDSWGKSGA